MPDDFSNSAMIAYPLPPELAGKLTLAPGEWETIPPEQMHLTLVFLGDPAVLDRAKVDKAIQNVLDGRLAVDCKISGLGIFTPEEPDAKRPFYASVDGPHLPELRQALVNALQVDGFTLPDDHGFSPHITLAYLNPGAQVDPSVMADFQPIPFTLDRLALAWGNEWSEYRLVIVQPKPDEFLSTVSTETVKSLDLESSLIAIGGGVKALGIEERGGKQYGRVGGYLVLFGDPAKKDLTGQYFTSATYFGPSDGDQRDVMVHHGAQIKTGDPLVDKEMAAYNKKLLPPMSTKKDALGLWAETCLDLSDEYQKMVYDLAGRGVWKWSSGTAVHMIKDLPSGEITQWPIVEGSLTPTPAEPRMLDHRVMPLKALLDIPIAINPQPGDSGGGTGAQAAAPAGRKPAGVKFQPPIKRKKCGAKTMNLIDAIKQLVPGLSTDQINALVAILGLAGVDAAAAPAPEGDAGTMAADPSAVTDPTNEPIRSVDLVKLANQLKSMGFQPKSAEPAPAAAVRPVYQQQPAANSGKKSFPYILKLGDDDAAKKAILADAIGADYQERIYRQNLAFAKYLKGGERLLDGDEYRSLKTMYFPLDEIVKLAGEMDLSAVKTTMVEAQGDLGGYAVPPNYQSQISARLPGLTAVRAAGARVVTLTNSNSIEIPQYDGGDDRYVGNLRGLWGDETQAPSEKNAKLKMVTVNAHVYTYKVSESQSLVDDAANLVSLVMEDITMTEAIDEDDAFLVGDGVGKPYGILPGGANALSLTEVVTGHATQMTGDGVKALKRGVASQYRAGGVFVANSDTYGDIETIKGADGQYMFPDLSDDDMLLSRRAYESEAMSDVAASAYPLLFGNMKGYTIVERLGQSIQRFQDSNTGPNKVEYHVRRRLGGRVEQPWQFAVQKVAAS